MTQITQWWAINKLDVISMAKCISYMVRKRIICGFDSKMAPFMESTLLCITYLRFYTVIYIDFNELVLTFS